MKKNIYKKILRDLSSDSFWYYFLVNKQTQQFVEIQNKDNKVFVRKGTFGKIVSSEEMTVKDFKDFLENLLENDFEPVPDEYASSYLTPEKDLEKIASYAEHSLQEYVNLFLEHKNKKISELFADWDSLTELLGYMVLEVKKHYFEYIKNYLQIIYRNFLYLKKEIESKTNIKIHVPLKEIKRIPSSWLQTKKYDEWKASKILIDDLIRKTEETCKLCYEELFVEKKNLVRIQRNLSSEHYKNLNDLQKKYLESNLILNLDLLISIEVLVSPKNVKEAYNAWLDKNYKPNWKKLCSGVISFLHESNS